MSLLKDIQTWDTRMWHKVNVEWRSAGADFFAPFIREPKTWIPLYIFLAIFIPYKFGKQGLYWCLGFIITFALSDYTSASIIKPLVKRVRPCNLPELQNTVRMLTECGVGYSFPSTHATNHFALACFMSVTLTPYYKLVWIPALLWAFSVAWAQVYVGVHFPLDVLCGAAFGSVIGCGSGIFFKRKVGL